MVLAPMTSTSERPVHCESVCPRRAHYTNIFPQRCLLFAVFVQVISWLEGCLDLPESSVGDVAGMFQNRKGILLK